MPATSHTWLYLGAAGAAAWIFRSQIERFFTDSQQPSAAIAAANTAAGSAADGATALEIANAAQQAANLTAARIYAQIRASVTPATTPFTATASSPTTAADAGIPAAGSRFPTPTAPSAFATGTKRGTTTSGTTTSGTTTSGTSRLDIKRGPGTGLRGIRAEVFNLPIRRGSGRFARPTAPSAFATGTPRGRG